MQIKLLLSLVLFPYILTAQRHTIPMDSASVWRIISKISVNGDCADVLDYRSFFKGDTTINGKVYSKLYSSGIQYQEMMSAGSQCDSATYYYENDYKAALRNDSGRVYFIDKYENNERLLYDFNLQVGDTVPAYNSVSGKSVVDSIKSININGRNLKQFFFGADLWIIEGIGSIYGLTEFINAQFYKTGYYHYELLCYAENDSVLLSPSGNCILNVGIEQNKAQSKIDNVKLFPNPASKNLNIYFENNIEQNLELSIYNTSGQLVKTTTIYANKSEYSINIQSLTKGLYFLQLKSKSNELYSYKFIKN